MSCNGLVGRESTNENFCYEWNDSVVTLNILIPVLNILSEVYTGIRYK